MNVNQMHIAIQQGVDKINSLQADMLLSEEIDVELNKSMSRFLNTKYGKNNKYGQGFENSQKRIDDLRTLVKEYSAPTIYKEQYNNNIWVDQFRLPSDYLYLVNQRSEVFINNCNPISFSVDDTSPTSYFVMPIDNLHNGTVMIDTLDVYVDPSNIALGTANIHTNGGAFVYPQDLQAYKDFLVNPINWPAGFELYFEEYGQLDFPNSIIIIIDPVMHSWFNWDSSITNSVSSSNLITSLISMAGGVTDPEDDANEVVYGQYVENGLGAKRLAPTSATREYALNKFIQHDDISTLLDDPFNTTKHTSPLTTIRGRYIDLYTNDIFIIDKVKITYIRKPKEISLPLAVGCELPEHTHQEIVDMTVGSILEGISDPRYKSQSIEAGKNE
tara:strand:- start:7587 stop:8747 length:1161 start_codon:yes stop_codon:yes gene_type:complete